MTPTLEAVIHPLLQRQEVRLRHAVREALPRLSNRIRRVNEARRSSIRANGGYFQACSTCETHPGTRG
jgi:hypothetical protein